MAIDGIQNRIYTIRDVQVMLDSDLAKFYGTETKLLNRAVKRNRERFPEEFMFQLTEYEYEGIRSQLLILKDSENLRFQNGTSSSHGGRRYFSKLKAEFEGQLKEEAGLNSQILENLSMIKMEGKN